MDKYNITVLEISHDCIYLIIKNPHSAGFQKSSLSLFQSYYCHSHSYFSLYFLCLSFVNYRTLFSIAALINKLLFTPFPATRFAMHRIYANRINSRSMSRVFCDLRSQKTPRGILPVNSNINNAFKTVSDFTL